MQIDIRAKGFGLTPALRTHAEHRLRLAFGSIGGRGLRVGVRLADGGTTNKICRVRVRVPDAPPVVVEQCESDLLLAIDRAADRAARAVSRQLAGLRAGSGVLGRDEPAPAGAGRRAF